MEDDIMIKVTNKESKIRFKQCSNFTQQKLTNLNINIRPLSYNELSIILDIINTEIDKRSL